MGSITSFSPQPREGKKSLLEQHALFSAEQISCHLMNAIPSLLAILNRHRQLVFANRPFLDLLGVDEIEEILGQRPGEVLSCQHASASRWGCGDGDACATCGAALALLGAQGGSAEIRECRITRQVDGQPQALDLEVWATPLQFRGEPFTVFALSDISHSKHRSVMEKLFFHDVLNVIGTIRGFSELLQTYEPHDRQDIYALIHQACQQVIDQVQAQRTLLAAEKRELQVKLEPLISHEFLRGFVDVYRHHDLASGRNLELQLPQEETMFLSDQTLLRRVLGNLTLNAFEAVNKGETVTLGCERTGDGSIRFWVHNPGCMEDEVRLQVFQRSFSTKGPGRGLGTYSVRLLSSYLKGMAQVTSTPETGTCFSVSLPLGIRGS